MTEADPVLDNLFDDGDDVADFPEEGARCEDGDRRDDQESEDQAAARGAKVRRVTLKLMQSYYAELASVAKLADCESVEEYVKGAVAERLEADRERCRVALKREQVGRRGGTRGTAATQQ